MDNSSLLHYYHSSQTNWMFCLWLGFLQIHVYSWCWANTASSFNQQCIDKVWNSSLMADTECLFKINGTGFNLDKVTVSYSELLILSWTLYNSDAFSLLGPIVRKVFSVHRSWMFSLPYYKKSSTMTIYCLLRLNPEILFENETLSRSS